MSLPQETRKRKKQFKYLVDKSTQQCQQDQQDDHAEKESRKKVKKACIFCKRSHMPCEEARPCQRCVKRGISDKCRDAEPINDPRSRSRSSGSPSTPFRTPGASAPDPDFTPMMPISVLLSPAVQDTKRNSQAPIFAAAKDPRLAILSQAKQLPNAEEHQALAWNLGMNRASHNELLRLLEAGPSALDLSDVFGDKPTSLLSAPGMAGLQVGDPLLMNTAPNTPDRDDAQMLTARPRHLAEEEQATTAELRGIKVYSYTYGYAKLARWIQTRYSRESCEAVDRSLSVIRPKLLAISRSLPEPELLAVEEAFIRLVHHYQANVLEFVPVAMIVTRRTGEIYGGNEHAARLLGVPKSLFEGGQVSHFQLVNEKSAVELWDMYASECMGVEVDPPCGVYDLEVDRSLLLYNRPAFDPRTGDVFARECQDGKSAVVRRKVLITFEAKISQHGLPIMICATFATAPNL